MHLSQFKIFDQPKKQVIKEVCFFYHLKIEKITKKYFTKFAWF